jgi:hypothetical protein
VFVVVSVGGSRTLLVTLIGTASLILSVSIIEIQAIAATLLESFEFSLPPQTAKTFITRRPLVLMVPMVEGNEYPWMGLKVRCVD